MYVKLYFNYLRKMSKLQLSERSSLHTIRIFVINEFRLHSSYAKGLSFALPATLSLPTWRLADQTTLPTWRLANPL